MPNVNKNIGKRSTVNSISVLTEHHRLAVPDKYQRVSLVCSKEVGKIQFTSSLAKPYEYTQRKLGKG